MAARIPVGVDVACTLGAAALPGRIDAWRRLASTAVATHRTAGHVRLDLPASTQLAEVAELVAAEQTCCAFFGFAITVDDRGIGLEISAPADGQAALDALVGA